jgi:hypothetical protein
MSRVSGLGEPPPDDLDRELMQLEAELAKPARFIEPSAAERARMAAKRQSRQAGGSTRKGRRLREPVLGPGRTRDPWRPGSLPARRGGYAWRLMTVLIVIVILGAAGYGFARLDQRQHANSLTPLTNVPKPPGQTSPTLAEPFLGSPAQHYADGAAGIVIPVAQPVGSYSAAQVAAAYQTAKAMLVAAELDLPTLRGGAPDAFASLLIPEERSDFTEGLNKTGRDAQGNQNSTRAWVTSFAAGTQLVGNVIKVHGTMQAATATNNRIAVLQIRADYLFVYPVERSGHPSTLMRIVQRVAVDVDFGTYTDPGGSLQPWWQLTGGGAAGARCDINDGYVHPQFPNAAPDKVKPTGTPEDPYNMSTPPQNNGACHAITGT